MRYSSEIIEIYKGRPENKQSVWQLNGGFSHHIYFEMKRKVQKLNQDRMILLNFELSSEMLYIY